MGREEKDKGNNRRFIWKMITKYNFGKFTEIKILWIFIGIFTLGIMITLYYKFIELLIFSVIGLFALLKVLIAHETFLIMKEKV